MNFFAVYLADRFVFRITEFIRHWYVGGFRAISHHTLTVLAALDQGIAFPVTLRNFGKPLYGDYTPMGRVLGFLFRSFRIAIGAVIYPIVFGVAAALYLVWALIPAYIAVRIITGI